MNEEETALVTEAGLEERGASAATVGWCSGGAAGVRVVQNSGGIGNLGKAEEGERGLAIKKRAAV